MEKVTLVIDNKEIIVTIKKFTPRVFTADDIKRMDEKYLTSRSN